MAKPEDVTRTDNSKVVEKRHRSWKEEFALLYVALKEDPWIMLLFPMFFASNYFYTWRSYTSLGGSCTSVSDPDTSRVQ